MQSTLVWQTPRSWSESMLQPAGTQHCFGMAESSLGLKSKITSIGEDFWDGVHETSTVCRMLFVISQSGMPLHAEIILTKQCCVLYNLAENSQACHIEVSRTVQWCWNVILAFYDTSSRRQIWCCNAWAARKCVCKVTLQYTTLEQARSPTYFKKISIYWNLENANNN